MRRIAFKTKFAQHCFVAVIRNGKYEVPMKINTDEKRHGLEAKNDKNI